MFELIQLNRTWHKVWLSVFEWDIALDKAKEIIAAEPHVTKVALMCGGDGLITEFDKLNPLVDGLLDIGIKFENIVLVIGSMATQSTVDMYRKCVAERGWPAIKLVIDNAWEGASASRITDAYEVFDSTPRVKNKLLLMFNGEARPDRGFMLASLLKHDLVDRSYVSAYHTVDDYRIRVHLTKDGSDASHLTGLNDELLEILYNNEERFPIELSRQNYGLSASNSMHPVDDCDKYNDSYFSLIHETIFYDTSFNNSGHIPTLFLTEKTYKAIAAKHPFIIAQRPGILQALREQGYRTFSPFIDESYDLIDDDIARLHAIRDEVLRLSRYTDDEWLEFQHNVKAIVDHNFELLRSRTYSYSRVVV